jgi:hypothetical protein
MKKLSFTVLMTVIAFSTPALAAPLSMNDSDRDNGTEVGAGTKTKPLSLPDITPNALKVHAPKVHAPKPPKIKPPKHHK